MLNFTKVTSPKIENPSPPSFKVSPKNGLLTCFNCDYNSDQ